MLRMKLTRQEALGTRDSSMPGARVGSGEDPSGLAPGPRPVANRTQGAGKVARYV